MTREQFDKFVVSINGCLKVFESQTIKNAMISLYLSGGGVKKATLQYKFL